MAQLHNKRILVGITGGIAAYKAAELVRLLVKAGAEVQVVMTAAAIEFITPLTLQALSGNPVHTDLLDPEAEAGMGHIELARWADCIAVAPASANFLARLTQGAASDLLSTVCLATRAPIVLAPAMNQAMWENAATQQNVQTLVQRGYLICGPGSGVQACGEVGPGRMLEPGDITKFLLTVFRPGVLAGQKVVITAGPTHEPLDPVRYLTNRSSGKMGYALAVAAVEAGAEVVLVSGPTALPPVERATMVYVQTALEMLDASLEHAHAATIFVAAAAVADYRPATFSAQKIKKEQRDDQARALQLIQNPDIVATIAKLEPRPYTVGFAAETQEVEAYAKAKLVSKGLDMVIANDVSNPSIGFNSDNNAVIVVTKNSAKIWPEQNKNTLARDLITCIALELNTKA